MTGPSTVLVVDDDARICDLIQLELEDEGYRVITAPNGQAALDVLSEASINLILLDMRMPVMDGWAFADHYHQQNPPWAPVVVLTAAQDAAQRAADIGADGYLDKPFDLDQLRLTVKRNLRPAQRTELATQSSAVRVGVAPGRDVRAILESITDAFYALDADWHLTYVNSAAIALLHHTAAELLGHSLWEVYPEAIDSEFDSAFRRAMNERLPAEVQAYYPPFESWFAARALPTNDGGLFIYFRDVTQERRSTEGLARLAAIVESSSDAIIGKSLDGTITSWNPAAEGLYGYTAAEIIGRSIAVLVPPDLIDETPNLLARVGQGEMVSHYETERVHKNGQRVTVSLSLSPVRDSDTSIVGAAVIARDITERRRVDRELATLLAVTQAARAEAEAAVRARDEFLSIAAHELKTPVTVMKLAAQMLVARPTQPRLDATRMERIVDSLVAGSSRLAQLTDDLLDVARLQAGQLRVRLEELDISDLVQGFAAPHRLRLDSSHHHLIIEDAPVPSRVMGDSSRLQQVLTNLLDNSIKYSPDGGSIRLRVQSEDDGCVISIQDQGMGLPASTDEMIFQPFGRAKNAVVSEIQGMGLGLYICRQIAASHGGRLWATSAGENQGMTMRLWLPRIS